MEALAMLLPIIFLVLFFIQRGRTDQSWREMLAQLAKRYGLTLEPGRRSAGLVSSSLHHHATGVLEGRDVHVERREARGGRQQARFLVALDEVVPESLALKERLVVLGRAQLIDTGDADFDRRFDVLGPRAEVLACLNEKARTTLLGLASRGEVALRDGRLELVLPDLGGDVDEMSETLERVRAAAEALCRPGSAAERLAANAREATSADVRLTYLRALFEYHADDPAAASAAALAFDTGDLELQTAAAAHLGEVGAALLGDLASDYDPEAPARWLAGASSRTRASVARLLGAPPAGSERIDAEPLLLSLLGDDDEPVQLACLDALGKVGSLNAVEHILPLAQGLFRSRDVARAAKRASAAIQRRCGRANAGGLSLSAAGEGGALAVEQEAGALAVSESEDEETVGA